MMRQAERAWWAAAARAQVARRLPGWAVWSTQLSPLHDRFGVAIGARISAVEIMRQAVDCWIWHWEADPVGINARIADRLAAWVAERGILPLAPWSPAEEDWPFDDTPQSEEAIMSLRIQLRVDSAQTGKALKITTHSPGEASAAGTMIVLRQGEVTDLIAVGHDTRISLDECSETDAICLANPAKPPQTTHYHANSTQAEIDADNARIARHSGTAEGPPLTPPPNPGSPATGGYGSTHRSPEATGQPPTPPRYPSHGDEDEGKPHDQPAKVQGRSGGGSSRH